MKKNTIEKMQIIHIISTKGMQKVIGLLKNEPNLTEKEIQKKLRYKKNSRIFFYYKQRLQYYDLLEDVLIKKPSQGKRPYRKDISFVGNRLTKKCLRILKQLDAIKIK